MVGLALSVATVSALVTSRLTRIVSAAEPGDTLSESGPRQRWLADEVVVTLDESLAALGPGAEEAVRSAFEAWQATGAPVPTVRFERGRGAHPVLAPDGTNSVLVAPIDFEGHETDLAITIGFSHPKNGEITEADIVINSRHVFSILNRQNALATLGGDSPGARPLSCLGNTDGALCGQMYDLQNVLTHEVGHFWGLPEDFQDRSSTMYSCTSACEVHKRDLSATDAEALRRLYRTMPRGCSHSTAGERSFAKAFAPALIALAWLARRRPRRSIRNQHQGAERR